MFLPKSLGINRDTYPAASFYGDVKAYIRFKSPAIGLEVLGDPRAVDSPLRAVAESIAQLVDTPHDEKVRGKLGRELRLFGCAVRSTVRDRVEAILDRLRVLARHGKGKGPIADDVKALTDRLLTQLEKVRETWRSLRPDFFDGRLPVPARDTYQYVDEYMSLVTEEKLTKLVRHLDRIACPHLDDVRARVLEVVVDLQVGRASAGYSTVLENDQNDGETYLFQQSKLKKFVQSILWLDVSRAKEGQQAANIGAAIAAGAAMAFAVTATLLHSHWYLTNTVGFVIAAVVTYILKDRIKDWLKIYFANHMSRWLPDYRLSIRDPVTDVTVGTCRETFSFVSDKRVPKEILARRHASSRDSIEHYAKPENVIKYSKHVALINDELARRLHREHMEVHDIMRFSVIHLLQQADDPTSTVSIYSPEEDKVVRRKLNKVYHANVVMAFHVNRSAASPLFRKIRVVFDKRGIRRLEEVAT